MARNTYEPLNEGNGSPESGGMESGVALPDEARTRFATMGATDFDRDLLKALADASTAPPAFGPPAGTPVKAPAAEAPAAEAPAAEAPAPPGLPTSAEVVQASRVVESAATMLVAAYWIATVVFVVCALYQMFRGDDDGSGTDWEERFWAFAFGFGCVSAGLSVVHAIGAASGYGVLQPIIGSDKRFSTSLTQFWLWTVLIATIFGYLLGRVVFEDASFDSVIPGDTWDQYLILLGGPFAAAVLSKGIVTYKVQAGTLQKSEAAAPSASQVFSSDQGRADLVDAQYLLFNVIAMGYVIARLATTNGLPAIPSPLLALTSATAATYVGNKAAERNRPWITSLSPTTVHPGGEVLAYGSNFDPADHGDLERSITVTLSGVTDRLYARKSTDSMAVFKVPGSATAGYQTVTVTSSAGVDTQPVELQVLARVPVLTGVANDQRVGPGRVITLTGTNLGMPGERLAVNFGKLTTEGTVSADGRTVTVRVPDQLGAATDRDGDGDDGSIAVTVKPAGMESATASFAVDQPRIAFADRAGANSLTVGMLGVDSDPRLTVNGRSADFVETRSGLTVTLPPDVDANAELRLVVTDRFGRQSPAYDVAAVPVGS